MVPLRSEFWRGLVCEDHTSYQKIILHSLESNTVGKIKHYISIRELSSSTGGSFSNICEYKKQSLTLQFIGMVFDRYSLASIYLCFLLFLDHLIDLYINKQIGTPWSDGTEGITQCPITPRDTFVYQFVVDRSGTYLYHAHYGMQREAGLYGSIQVSVPDGVTEPFLYDYNRSIILNDWYHKTPFEQAT
ncbi:hypothetical protein GIB67_028536 [Kingdonia uniflora]|uniref:Plastocyanin-like domain-containing protein n=1 Tax=Kingdonia uniflora TaxID=39325 RepID=A0A7J7KVW8_9MAGN|nr:hypothetical protein GIB67_028536 [Kingdonia uniflora]